MSNNSIARGVFARAMIAAASVAVAASMLPQEAAGQQAAYQGIYVVSQRLKDDHSLLPSSIYSTPYINGIMVSALWYQIEPSPGTYDWSLVDAEVNAAVASGKYISIGVTAGMYTPTWLYSAPYNVPYGNFMWGAHSGTRKHACEPVTVPVPWDSNYLQAYGTMIQALSNHLQSIQGAYNLVTRVKLTGANTATDELHLAYCSDTEGPQTWQALGYTPNLMYAAGQSLMQSVNTAFPDQLLDLNIIENGGLPPINNEGEIVSKKSKTYVNVEWNLITWALSSASGFNTRFGVQWNAFNSNTANDPPQMVLDAGRQGAVMGWQTNDFGGIPVGTECNGGYANAVPCDDPGYQGILDGAINVGGQFVEVWPVNVPEFPSAFEQAEGLFQ
ncbi:MAG TPA: hypothetical protein VMF67_02965 [Rhizomicrobium sp.]|nr:hypothetical protein [Rhizomicrobium sp.]